MTLSDTPTEDHKLRTGLSAVFALLLLVNCFGLTSAQETDEIEPQTRLDIAVDRLQAADSFKLTITQTGEPYPLALSFDGVNMLPATLSGVEAQYLSPNELHISALVQLFIPLSLDIYSRDDRQWLSFPSGAPWLQLPAFEDFDINRLLAPADGIEYVMANLQDLQIVDAEALLDEEEVWHLRARAAGAGVSGLLFGFIEPQDDVEINAYVRAADQQFALLEITMLETLGDPEKEPSVWHIQFHDYDALPDFEPPD